MAIKKNIVENIPKKLPRLISKYDYNNSQVHRSNSMHCLINVPNTRFFCSLFSHIQIEYENLLSLFASLLFSKLVYLEK